MPYFCATKSILFPNESFSRYLSAIPNRNVPCYQHVHSGRIYVSQTIYHFDHVRAGKRGEEKQPRILRKRTA